MVAIITGAGLGLENSSADVLGAKGMVGGAAQGLDGERIYVNAATGNLVIQRQDDILSGKGPDDVLAQTYNSLGPAVDDNADNWTPGGVSYLAWDSVNGRYVRYASDGSSTYFTDLGNDHMESSAGDGAYMSIAVGATVGGTNCLTWMSGDGAIREVYETSTYRLLYKTDSAGNQLTFHYNGSGLVDQITNSAGEYTAFTYSGNKLVGEGIHWLDPDGTTWHTSSQFTYGYDGSNRLNAVTVDKTPDNLGDSSTYSIAYGYDGTSGKVNSITQSDGSSLTLGYTSVGGVYRVTSFVQTSASGVTRTTSLSYNTTTRVTTVTDPNSQATEFWYDTSGQLTKIVEPAPVSGGTALTTQFAYDSHGNVTDVTDPKGLVTHYDYDSHGNRILERDAAGNTIKRTFDNRNHVVTQTIYTTPDPDGSGSGQPSGAQTTRYVYDYNGKLRFEVDPIGHVVEYRYDAYGQRASAIDYKDNLFSLSGLGDQDSLPMDWSSTNLWVDPTTPASWLGDTSAVTSAGTLNGGAAFLISGAGWNQIYEQFSVNAGDTVKFSFTVEASSGVDFGVQGGSSTAQSPFNYYGANYALWSDIPSGPGVLYQWGGGSWWVTGLSNSTATDIEIYREFDQNFATAWAFFSVGRFNTSAKFSNLVIRTGRTALEGWVTGLSDKSGTQRTDYTYDWRGNLATSTAFSKVQTNGSGDTGAAVTKTDYLYDRHGMLLSRHIDGESATETYAYDGLNRITSYTDLAGTTTSYTFSDTTPTTTITVGGRTTVQTFNKAGELISSSVSGSGVSAMQTDYMYDSLGQLRVITDPAGNKTYFVYDQDGRKVFDIAANGAVVQYKYDADSQVIATVAYNTLMGSTPLGALISSGAPSATALSDTLTWVSSNAGSSDRWAWTVYDSAGRVIQTIDALGAAVTNTYDGVGNLTATTAYATPLTSSLSTFKSTPPTTLQSISTDAADRTTRLFYDADNRLVGALDAEHNLSQIVYDGAGEKVSTTLYATQPNSSYWASGTFAQLLTSAGTSGSDATTRQVYDARGLLIGSISPEGSVTGLTYNAHGLVTKTVRYNAAYGSSGLVSASALASWITSNASSTYDRVSRGIYSEAGQLIYSVDPEAYVTKFEYNALGQVTKQVRYPGHPSSAIGDSDTPTTVAGKMPGSVPSDAEVTQFAYDSVGRLTDTTDAEGAVTRRAYDALGNVTDLTVAQGTGDAVVTHYAYDVLGRVTSQSADYGGLAAVTGYHYDSFGEIDQVTDALSHVTTTAYDLRGQATSVTAPLSSGVDAVTGMTYNAFGEVVSATDPRSNVSYAYYDHLGRKTLSVSAEKYVTETAYRFDGQVSSVKLYAVAATNTPSATTLPSGHTTASTTSFEYDKAGRLTKTKDAENDPATSQPYYEQYTLNTFGDRTASRNKLGGTTNYTYDRRGLILTEELPIASVNSSGSTVASTVTNTYAYDGFGNLSTKVEAYGLSEARTTSYAYDRLNRLVTETGQAVYTTGDSLVVSGSTSTPTKTLQYDLRGNLIKTVDQGGGATYAYYDHLDRRIAQANAVKALSVWTYDANGNVKTLKTYGDLLTASLTAGGSPPSPVNSGNYRLISYDYDYDNRQVATTVAGFLTGAYNGSSYATASSDLVTGAAYDAAGNLISQTDANGAVSYFFYDKAGRKIAMVDALKFITAYELDAEGNVTKETRYATALGGSITAGTLPTVPSTSGDDRITEFTYDKMGRRLTEKRKNVAASTVNSSGALSTSTVDAEIVYAYNGLGQVLTKTEATGDVTTYVYDNGGRLTSQTQAAYTDYASASVARRTVTSYNGLNNITRVRVQNGSSTDSADPITTFAYGTGGRLSSTTDAVGATTDYEYDLAGRVTKAKYTRLKADGSTTLTEANATRYDLLGRAIYQAKASFASTWTVGDYTEIAYNAYGEMATKGVNGGAQETYAYDAAGRLERTNSGDGTLKFYLYDKAGHQTLTISSSGTDLAGYATASAAHAAAIASSHSVESPNTGINTTVSVYDARGQATSVRLPSRQLDASTSSTVVTAQTYNAFGEVTSETDARSKVTNFSYNTLGKLITTEHPLVSVTSESGSTSNVNPTEQFYFDKSGRMVAVRDANNNLSTRLLLAGSGYDGADPIVLADFHADGEVSRQAVDVYGNVRKLTNELGVIESRDYDALGRLTVQTHPLRTGAGSALVDYYVYDSQGQRTQHWNSFLTSSYKELTDYDREGRVSSVTDFGGAASTYGYEWSGSIATSGLATFGGWTKSTSTAGHSAVDYIDYFGRTTGHTDFGGNTYSMTFDKAGRLTAQTVSATLYHNESVLHDGSSSEYWVEGDGWVLTGETYDWSSIDWSTRHEEDGYSGFLFYTTDGHLVDENARGWVNDLGHYTTVGSQAYYTIDSVSYSASKTTNYGYFNTGHIYTIGTSQSGSPSTTTTYGYDAAGNMTAEAYSITNGSTTVSLQNATSTYDGMNRLVTVSDAGYGGSWPISLANEYDAAGNVRRTVTSYKDMVTSGTTSQDYWYKYDAMGRVTLAKGQLVSGSIVLGANGRGITYDDAGRRLSVTSNIERTRTTSTWNEGYTWYEEVPGVGWEWAGYWYPFEDINQYSMWYDEDFGGYLYLTFDGNHVVDSGGYEYYPASPTYVPHEVEGYYTYDTEPYASVQVETYAYSEDNFLISTSLSRTNYSSGSDSGTLSTDTRDLMGRTTSHVEYSPESYGTPTFQRSVTYDARSNVTQDTTIVRKNDGISYTSVTDYTYTIGGVYQGGVLISSSSANSHASTSDPSSSVSNTYSWWDGAQLRSSINSISADSFPGGATYTYDAGGALQSVTLDEEGIGARPRTQAYATDARGHVMLRQELATAIDDLNGMTTALSGFSTSRPAELYYYQDGMRIGDLGNNGAGQLDYAGTIADRRRRSGCPRGG